MAVNINFLAGKEENVNNVPLQQGKVLFAVDHEDSGDYVGYIYYDYYNQELKKVVRVSMGSGGGSTANNPILSIADMLGNTGDEVVTANLAKATLQLPNTINAQYFSAHTDFILSDIQTILEPQSRLYSNGLLLFDPAAISKQGWMRIQTGNDNTSILEIAMSDSQTQNGISNLNKIVARLYNAEGEVFKEATLLDLNGTTSFPGPVYCDVFVGDLQGNASSATIAENDEFGDNIADKYLTSLEDSLLDANQYLIDLITGNGRISKTIEIPAATEETTGLITANTQTLAGWKTLQGYLIFPWMSDEGLNQEDLIFGTTGRYDYDFKQTGLTGYFSVFDDFWQITGHQNTLGTGYLELSIGNTGEESAYLTRYSLNNGNPILSDIITLMDINSGSVLRRLTIIDDDSTVEADLDYGLFVEEETGLYGNLYTSGSIRLQCERAKDGAFYIVPDEELLTKKSSAEDDSEASKYFNRDKSYHTYLQSLYLEENLEVFGYMFLNNLLITKDILPDFTDTYNIGRGLPEMGPDDNYYLNSFIRNMYSNKIIVQGLVEESSDLSVGSTNPHILFRENIDGVTQNPIYLYYTNHDLGETYKGYQGLRLTGETRPWLDIDGIIYSRYDNDKYISLFAEDETNELLITRCGIATNGELQKLTVGSDSTTLLLQNIEDAYFINIDTSKPGMSNTIQSNRTYGIDLVSMFLSQVEDGAAKLINQATKDTLMSFQSFNTEANLINIKANEDSYINLKNNLITGLNLYVQTNNNSYFNLISDGESPFNFGAYHGNAMLLNIFNQDGYELNSILDNNASIRLVMSKYDDAFLALDSQDNNAYLSLKSNYGSSTYLTLNNGNNYWNIFTTSNDSNDYPGALQFKLNGLDLSRIIFANDSSTGIELFGSSPYIDFHFGRAGDNFTSRIQAIDPISDSMTGTLAIYGQVNIPDINPTDIRMKGGGILLVGQPNANHLAIDECSVNAKSSYSAKSTLYLNRNEGSVLIGTGGLTIAAEEPLNSEYKLYVKGSGYFTDELRLAKSLYVDGDVHVSGKTNLNEELTVMDKVTINGNLLPYSGDFYDIGSLTNRWRDVYANTFYGDLKGTADTAIQANSLTHTFAITVNANTYAFDGSRDLTFQFYAPQGPATKNQHVLYWDNGTPAWGDPNWVVPQPDPSDSGYVRKIGDQMSGLLILDKGARLGTSVYLDGDTFCALGVKGSSNLYETTIRLRATAGSQYGGYADIVYDTTNNNFLKMTRGLCIVDSVTDYPGQLRLINRESERGVYLYNNGSTFSVAITDVAKPYSYSPVGDKKAITVDLTSGIVDCGYGVRGAVWNDYAEYRESDELEPGRCVYEVGDDSLTRTTERLMPGCNIVSDTFGFAQGETDKAKTPIATAGRVLAYTLEDRNEFKPGDAVCSGPNGTVSLMTREEIREWPDRIVGTVSCVPNYEYWGKNDEVIVNGRIWVKVK